jgi:membrane protein
MAWAFLAWIILIASVGITFWASVIGLKGIVKFLPIVNIIISTLVFGLIYWFFPNRKVKFKEAYIGALFASIMWEIVKILYSFYVTKVVDYSKVFGSLSAMILLLLWLYYSAFIFLFGAELSYVYARQKYLKKKKNSNTNITLRGC